MKIFSWRTIVAGGVILVVIGGLSVFWLRLNSSDLLGRGLAAAWKEDYDSAILYLDLAILRDPTSEFAYFNRAYAYGCKGELAKSNADYDRLLKLHPDFGPAYLNRGDNYRTMRDFPKAIADETKAIELGTPMAHVYRGMAYYDQGDYDKAISDFSEDIEPTGNVERAGYLSNSAAVIAKNPIEPFFHRGMAYFRKGDYDHGIPDLRKAIILDPKNLQAHEVLGNMLADKGAHDESVAVLNTALSLGSKDANVLNDLGRVHLAAGELDAAMENLTKAIATPPPSALPYVNRATLYNDRGEYDKAIADCNEVIRLQPDLAAAYYNRALSYSGKGDYTRVIEDCSKAIQLKPDFSNVYTNRASAYLSKVDFEHAVQDLQKAIELNPHDAAAYNNLGRACWMKQYWGQALLYFSHAIDEFSKGSPDKSMLTSVYCNRGVTYFSMRDFKSAIQDLTKALEFDPANMAALNCRGASYAEKGDLVRAEADFKEVLRLKPDDEGAKQNLAKVQAMARSNAR